MKHVVKADGSVEIVPLTPEEEAQAAIDAEVAQRRRVEREKEEARQNEFLADSGQREISETLKTLSPAELEAYVRNRTAEDLIIGILKLLAVSGRRL